MSMQTRIHDRLVAALAPTVLEVINESHGHNVPADSETHFKIVVVSEAFNEVNLVGRHRKVNELVEGEFENGLHALSIQAFTPKQWEDRGGKVPPSPPCQGGGIGVV